MIDIEKITVLIIENDKPEVNLIRDTLIDFGVTPQKIKSTNKMLDGFHIIQIEEPKIIFVNIHLSDLDGHCDGALMLKDFHEKNKDNDEYNPFIAAISMNMLPEIQRSIAKYSTVQYGKFQKGYSITAIKRFLMIQNIPFKSTPVAIDESNYLNKIISSIKNELKPFNFSSLNPSHQLYIIDLICFIIPALDKRAIRLESIYKKIAEKHNANKSSAVKTAVTRAFKNTFIKTDNFLDLYTGNDGKSYPTQKEFYTYTASLIKNKLQK